MISKYSVNALMLALSLSLAEKEAHGDEEAVRKTGEVIKVLEALSKPEKRHFEGIKEPDIILCEIFNNKTNNEELRRRAIYAAGLFPTKKVYASLLELLGSPEASVVLKTEAMISLSRGFGEKSLSGLRKFLESGDKGVRVGAAVAISYVPSKKAVDILSAYLASESEIEVKAAIKSAIKKINETFQKKAKE